MKVLLKILALMVFISLTLAPKFALAEVPEHEHSGLCEYQEFKLHMHSRRLDEAVVMLDYCRVEAESDLGKSCFWEIKIRKRELDKVEKWLGRLNKCKDWYNE